MSWPPERQPRTPAAITHASPRDPASYQHAVMLENALYMPVRALARNLISREDTLTHKTCERVADVATATVGVTAWTHDRVGRLRRRRSRQHERTKGRDR